MSDQKSCSGCSSTPKLIFACSGGSDVGEISDRAARKLTKEGVGKMYCLTGIGGRIGGIMKTTETADKVLVIDGCPLNCAKKAMEAAGFVTFSHLRLVDLGIEKGKSPATEERIDQVVKQAKSLI